MPKKLPTDDFRAIRVILEPDDFAYGPEGPDPAPTDLVDHDTWHDITLLPDDVSIRTSNYHGELLKRLSDLWGAWIEALGDDEDQLLGPMLDAADEFQACTFNALHGYYRQAFGCLRNALEVMVIGAHCQVCSTPDPTKHKHAPHDPVTFGQACDRLTSASALGPIAGYLRQELNDSFFDQKSANSQGGWARRLYFELSEYEHSRPPCTNSAMWQSNGPIYAPESFRRVAVKFFETSALCYLLTRVCRPTFVMPQKSLQLFQSDRIRPMKIAYVAYVYLFHVAGG